MRLAAALVLCAALAGCAIAVPREEVVIYRGCDGKDHATIVEVKVGFPGLECIALAAQEGEVLAAIGLLLGFPALACVAIWPEDSDRVRKAVMWLYPVNLIATVEHEFDHLRGMHHPFFLPFLESSECP